MGASLPATRDRQPGVPDLPAGITRLVGERRTPGLHRLVTAALATADGPAYWVDAANAAAPTTLYRVAPDRLALARLRVARAFTAYQHRSLVRRTAGLVDAGTSLVVVSATPALYADDDLLAGEGAALLRASAKDLLALRRDHDVSILVSHAREADPDAADLLAACADRTVECVESDCGCRFVGDGFETVRYPDARAAQATLAAFEDGTGASRPAGTAPAASDPPPAGPAEAAREERREVEG